MLLLSINNLDIIVLYFLATFVATVSTYIIKVRIYTIKTEDTIDPSSKSGNIIGTIRAWTILFILGSVMLFLPFAFLYLFGWHAWLVLINSYISGVNASEIIIYLIHRR